MHTLFHNCRRNSIFSISTGVANKLWTRFSTHQTNILQERYLSSRKSSSWSCKRRRTFQMRVMRNHPSRPKLSPTKRPTSVNKASKSRHILVVIATECSEHKSLRAAMQPNAPKRFLQEQQPIKYVDRAPVNRVPQNHTCPPLTSDPRPSHGHQIPRLPFLTSQLQPEQWKTITMWISLLSLRPTKAPSHRLFGTSVWLPKLPVLLASTRD